MNEGGGVPPVTAPSSTAASASSTGLQQPPQQSTANAAETGAAAPLDDGLAMLQEVGDFTKRIFTEKPLFRSNNHFEKAKERQAFVKKN